MEIFQSIGFIFAVLGFIGFVLAVQNKKQIKEIQTKLDKTIHDSC